ncbi:hypothetical protein [Colwellia sp. E150_009]|jgi:putative PLP-dependent aminotransferase (TIGR04422 family)
MNDVWMWPKTEINNTTVTDNNAVLTEIEQYFSALYAPYKVVYFSRARVAIMAISAVRELSRPQLTFVQPFSSHCVLSAISYQSTPTTVSLEQSTQQVIYHQWGNKTQINQQVYQNVLIEDMVDSLILTNDKSELFPNDAPFCVISLPKILPVSVGSIVICQQDDDYQQLIKQRLIMAQDIGSFISHIDISAFKEATLQAKPTLVPVIDTGIQTLVENTSNKIQSNLLSIKMIFPELSITITDSAKRLPSNVIISTSKYKEEELYKRAPFNVIEKQRTYYNYQEQCCEKVWLLPCHCQAGW